MSAPFRELFVELPLALFETFETLQCIGEAGVAAAYKDWYPDKIPVRAARRDEYGHFPGCRVHGCEATRCRWPL